MTKKLINFGLKTFSRLFPPQKPVLFSGVDSTLKLAALMSASGHKRPLLVTEKFLLEIGLLDKLVDYFKSNGMEVSIFDGIIPNPTFEVCENGVKVGNENRCDSVIVVGGGSAIDAAKVIASCCSSGKTVEQVVGILKVGQPTLPFFAVPTTSGTGSEVTNAAVISETTTHQKKFVIDGRIIPGAAALDPMMLQSLPPHITAATSMDALTHAIEAYSSVNRFSDAERDAKLAIKLMVEYLPKAYDNGKDLEARELVALSSFLAGYAFTRSGLGYVHAISHQISAHYNTPHGLANAIILPRVLHFNKAACADRFAELERMLAGNENREGSDEELAQRFVERVEALAARVEIPSGLEELKEADFDSITKNALKEAKNLYAVPRRMSVKQCKEILKAIADGGKKKADSTVRQANSVVTSERKLAKVT